jgi:membrane protein
MPKPTAIRRALVDRNGLARTLLVEVREDRVLGLAAETAFFTVLSMFPALLVATSLLSLLDVLVGADVAARAQQRVTDTLDLILTDQASGAISSVESFFEGNPGGLLTFATVGALVTLSGAWAVVIDALNHAYDTVERRTWVRRRLLGLLLGVLTVVVVVVALAALVVGPLLGKGEDLADLVGLGEAFAVSWNLLRVPLLLVGVTLWVMLVFHYAPNRRTSWRSSVPGAVTTAVLWVLATVGFSIYMRVVGARNPVLGAFGGGAIIMLWVYLLSVALLLGGEINAVLEQRRRRERSRG